MEAEIQGTTSNKILIILPEDGHEATQLEILCRNNGRLVAVIKYNPQDTLPHIEIRKERP